MRRLLAWVLRNGVLPSWRGIMRVERIREAVERARLLARQGEEFIQATKTEEGRYMLICGNKQSGQLRRTSMDLTRALAEMRKP
jgi:hypothetical protein